MTSNVVCSMRRLAVLATVTSLLTGCATVGSEPQIASVCPPVVEYSRAFGAHAAEELEVLPDGSAIAEMMSDYAVMRDQARACAGHHKIAPPENPSPMIPETCRFAPMNEEDEKRIAARLAKIMAMMCVRNTGLETIHAGVVPVTRTGDYSDVIVLDADGRKIPWSEISHIDDDLMRDLMRQIVNRLYTFHLKCDDEEFRKQVDRWMTVARKWDEPELDQSFLKLMGNVVR